jgi:transcription antitermination factor NusA-like protein
MTADTADRDEEEDVRGASADASADTARGHAVFRLLCLESRVGGLIGKSGANVKRIVAETGAAVKVLESAAQCNERVVLVSAVRERGDDDGRCAACEAATMVVEFLTSRRRHGEEGERGREDASDGETTAEGDGAVDVEAREGESGAKTEAVTEEGDAAGAIVTLRLLVPAGQAGHLIGKGGENIREIRKLANGAHVEVQEVGQVPSCATSEDRVVEINGAVHDVRTAAKSVFELLKGFLVDSSVLGYFQPTFMVPRDAQGGVYTEYSASALTQPDPTFAAMHVPVPTPLPMQMQMQMPMPMPMPMPVPMQMPMSNAPMQPPMYAMPTPPPMIKDTVEISIEEVTRIMGSDGANISTIAQISGCQVSLMESDPKTKTSDVEVKGPHEMNIAAAKSLIKAFASGQVPEHIAQQRQVYPYFPSPVVFPEGR